MTVSLKQHRALRYIFSKFLIGFNMVVGNVISLVIELLIAGALLTTAGLSAYYAAANYTGITAVIK